MLSTDLGLVSTGLASEITRATNAEATKANLIGGNNLSGNQSVAHRYRLLNAKEFADFANTWSQANGTGVVFANPDTLHNTDWQSQIFRTAPVSRQFQRCKSAEPAFPVGQLFFQHLALK